MISGFCLEVDENCAFLCYYAGSNGSLLSMFWHNLLVPSKLLDS